MDAKAWSNLVRVGPKLSAHVASMMMAMMVPSALLMFLKTR
jgi:hypothetical protein